MKKRSLIILGILICIQLAIPFRMIHSRETILREGELFRFKTRPIDPTDPFQGKYVRLDYHNDFIPCSETEKPDLARKEPIYAFLETDTEGFTHFSGWSRTPPETGSYLKTRYLYEHSTYNAKTKKRVYKGFNIDIPFDRFYMDEAKAPRAEQIARDTSQTTNCWAAVRIFEGKAVIEDVFAEGKSLRELAAKKDEQ